MQNKRNYHKMITLSQASFCSGVSRWILKKDIFNFFDYEDYSLEKDVLPKLISISEVSVYLHEGFWQCMDTKDEYDYLEKLWASHEAPWASN